MVVATPRSGGVWMGRPRAWAAAATGRPALLSPGRPPAARREHRQRFWQAVADGFSSEDAGVVAGVSPAVGTRWFREGGGMRSVSHEPLSGRYLSFAEREELRSCAPRVRCAGVRARIGRAPSTISRQLHRAPRPEHRVTELPMNSPRIRRALSATTAGRAPKSCPGTTPPADASTTFASPANDDPTRSYRPGTGRCRLGRAEQSRFIWWPSSRTGLRQWHIHWPRVPHAVTVPIENDASTAASPRPLPVGPNQKRGL